MGAKTPEISVVTVTYNLVEAGRCDSFKRALASTARQKGGPFEHIIQDGSSTDGTAEFILDTIRDRPNIRFESAPDSGLYDAMNIAAARASGDYLIFLNSDDALASDEILHKSALVLAQSGADFAFGSAVSETPDGQRNIARSNLKSVLQRMPFCHNSLILRRAKFLELGGHDTRLRVAADYDLVLRLLAAGLEGVDLKEPVSLFWSRGVSSDDAAVARDYATIWQQFYARHTTGQPPSQTDFEAIYRRGHMPIGLMLATLRESKVPLIRQAARHSLAKSVKRTLQPWRY